MRAFMKILHALHARNVLFWASILFTVEAVSIGGAEAALSVEERLAKLETPGSPVNSGDNAWMLTSAALVLMMTAPGLILFYGGLVRSKNVLGTMMHSMFLMGLISVVWVVFGYSMAFGEGN